MKIKLLLAVAIFGVLAILGPAPVANAEIFSFDLTPDRDIAATEQWGVAGFVSKGNATRLTLNKDVVVTSKFPYIATLIMAKDLEVGKDYTICLEVSKQVEPWTTTESACKTHKVLTAAVTPSATPAFVQGKCPKAPARLVVGKQARIAGVGDTPQADDKPLDLREKPTKKSTLMADMPASTKSTPSVVDVIGGPVCDGIYRWYQVRFGEEKQVGWAAEVGPAGLYNLLPLDKLNTK